MTDIFNEHHHYLCSCDDIPDKSAKSFCVNTNNKQLDLFVIQHEGCYYAYVNSCPHTGINLNWLPDQFYDYDHQYIQCATHGALFRINDGFSIFGPCAGKSLTPLKLHIADDQLFVILHDE